MRQWRRMRSSPDIDRIHLASHTEIVDAIVAHDADAAETALRRHLATAWDLVRVTFPHLTGVD